MPGKSKKGGGLESSPVYKKQGYGETKSPFMMKGFSGFGNSPLKDDATTGEAPHPKHHKKNKKKSDEAFIAAANRQRKEQIANLSKERNISIKEATQIYLKKVGTKDALAEAANRADN